MAKTALITGASRGLGLALAKALAERGWSLIIDARGADALQAAGSQLGEHTQVIVGDVTDPEHRRQLAAAAEAQGGLDVLVNNASLLGPSPQPNLLDYPLDVLEQVYRTNVIAPLAVIQAVKDHLKPDARILNVTSDAGVEAYPGWGGYGSSKAALEHLSAILAQEQPNLRIYWVDPGDIRTQMQQDAFPGEDISDRPLPEVSVPGFLQLIEDDLPGGRFQAQHINPENAIRELRLVLTTNDFENAHRFYVDGLGLKLLEDWSTDTAKGMLFDAGRATLELNNEAQSAELDTVEVGQRSAGPVRLAFRVADTAETAQRMIAAGSHALGEIIDTPWRDRNQRLTAPDNLQVTLFQPLDG